MKLIFKAETWIHDIIDKYLFQIAMIFLVLMSAAIRIYMAPITDISADYKFFLVPWVEFYQEHGFSGLNQVLGNYYVPYNLFLAMVALLPWEPWVLIALVSCLCDYIIAFFVYRIARELLSDKKASPGGDETSYQEKKAMLAGVITLFLPAVIMNGALWKQCDSIYVCFLIISLYYAIRERYGWSLFYLGISFAFKMQAIFLLPFFIALYIFRKKGLSLLHFLWIPVCYFLGGVPSMLTGRSMRNVLGTYYRQTNDQPYMTLGFPNLYSFNMGDFQSLHIAAILGTITVFIIFVCIAAKYRDAVRGSNLVYLGIWCLWTCVMFLPGMHERYNFAVIILLTMFFIIRDNKKFWTAVVLNLIAAMTYGDVLFVVNGLSVNVMMVMAVFHMAAYLYVSYDLYGAIKYEDTI